MMYYQYFLWVKVYDFLALKMNTLRAKQNTTQWPMDSIWMSVRVSGVGIHLCASTFLLTIDLVSSQWLFSSTTVTAELLLNECANETSLTDGSRSLILLHSLLPITSFILRSSTSLSAFTFILWFYSRYISILIFIPSQHSPALLAYPDIWMAVQYLHQTAWLVCWYSVQKPCARNLLL